MPELPEVETIKIGLENSIVGKTIADIKVLREKSFQGESGDIIGKTIDSVSRRAKLLIIKFKSSRGNFFLVIHLKMTGQLIYKFKMQNEKCKISSQNSKSRKIEDKKRSYGIINRFPNKYTRVIIEFKDGSKLFFNDLRVFGWMKIIKKAKSKMQNYSSKLKTNNTQELDEIIGERYGPEIFSRDFTAAYLKQILGRWGRPVKLLLLDQKKIAGIGNIYASEILFCASIAPHCRGRELVSGHPEKVEKLYCCIKKVLKMGIKYGGSTASDDAYRNVDGKRGRMQKYLKVYGKAGEKCPNKCGKKIRRMTLGGRGTFFCPKCQK